MAEQGSNTGEHPSAQAGAPAFAPVFPLVAARERSPLLVLALLTLLPAAVAALVFALLGHYGAGPLAYGLAGAVVGSGALALARAQAVRLGALTALLTQRSAQLAARFSGDAPSRERRPLSALAHSLDAMTTAVLRHVEDLSQRNALEVQNGLDLQREYALMQMLRNLATAANHGGNLEQALEASLREIGDYLDWPIGRLVFPAGEDAGSPAVRTHWYAPDPARFAAFITASDTAPGENDRSGLIGRAQETNLSHWISNLARLEGWPRRDAALACGLRTGFVIPIASAGNGTAYIEFYSDHRIEAGPDMLELVEAIGVALWQTANRSYEDAGARESIPARQLAAALGAMDSAVGIVGPDSRLLWANASLVRLLGDSAGRGAALIGMDLSGLLFGYDAASATQCRGYLAALEAVNRVVLPAHGPDGTQRWYELDVLPLPAAATARGPTGQPSALLTVRDISHERATQHALSEALQAAKLASQSKSQFLANMSHEIRTPMNGVLGMAELLLGTELDERQRRFIESLYRSGEALLDIINDILDFSKIEAGKLELEAIDFDLRALVEDLIELLAPRAHQKRIELAVKLAPGLPVTVRGDPTRLRQILFNIVGNAIKFTERGEVVLTVEPLVDDGQADAGTERATRVRFLVRDTGIGMRQDAVERLFSVFMQADQSSSRRYGGTGLGLAICRQLSELMGGSITASSRIGEGSVFQMDLPLPHGDARAVAIRPSVPASLAGCRALIVEDNPTNRRILDEQLTAAGMHAALAENGRQALQMLRVAAHSATPFAIAIIDMKMPIMDGLTLVERIRSEPALAALRLVMLTSICGRDDARHAQSLGVDAYLSKPVRQQELMGTLATVLDPEHRTPPARAQALPLAGLEGLRVLVVEDNPVNQEVVCAMLTALGCQARLADNGLTALGALERENFDVVLMDCQMPVMDGFEAVRRLRDPEYRQHDLLRARRLPVIALTANALAGDAERCRTGGFSDYLAKPFRQRDLGEMLLRVLAPVAASSDVPTPTTTPEQIPVPAPLPVALPTRTEQPLGALDERVLADILLMEKNGARNLMARLIDAYRGSSARLLAAADEGFATGQAADVLQSLHTLKSSSANLGALAFSAACSRLEQLARAGSIEAAATAWPELRVAHEHVLAALQALAQDDRVSPSPLEMRQ